ncbi:MAG: HDOD domain-containing protein [Deltaproteobacteria bacterium]|nr:HDOD domain-containing protein [Deltaproteobacteria bacterium]
MSEINYRLIFNGTVSDAKIKKLLVFFQKDLGLSNDKIQKLMLGSSRVIQNFSTIQSAELTQAELSKLGGETVIEPVCIYSSIPFCISQKQEKLIRKELSKILRCRSSLLMLYLQIDTSNPQSRIPSVMGNFGEEIGDYFRESDTIIPIDDTRILILAFATDRVGIVPLQNKFERALKKQSSEAYIMNSGYALFPDETQTLEKLLQLAANPREESIRDKVHDHPEDTQQKPSIEPAPAAETADHTDTTPFTICFREARGRIFKRLLNMDPQTLWVGLSAVPQADQNEFMFRLPFDAPTTTILQDLINFQPKRESDKFIENHFKAVIIQMEMEKESRERREMLEAVNYKLHRSDDLPTLPSIATDIFRIASNPSTSGNELTHIIMRDPALTSKLLKTVNSAFFGNPQKISSIDQAIILLGLDDIVDIAFGLAAAKIFDVKPLKGFVDPNHLWHHAICTALIAQNLCRDVPEYADLAFTAGLLHDVGKIFLIEKFADMYLKAFSNNANYNLPLFELEEDIFGTNHAIIGKELSSRWNLPDPLVNAITYHHQPFSAPSHTDLAAIIGLADYLYYKALEPKSPPAEDGGLTHWLTAGHWVFLNRLFKDMNQDRLNEMIQTADNIIEKNQDNIMLPQ